MVSVFPVGPPVRPFGLTAVQVFIGLTVLLVILQNTTDVRNRTWIGDITNRGTCGDPPSTLGDLVLYKQQRDAAFYVCPGLNLYVAFPLTCPIIYCQANGTFSTPDFATSQSVFFPANEIHVVVDESGEITSPNYPANYIPTYNDKIIAWSIMTLGKSIVFRINDFDIDSTTTVTLLCGDSEKILANETTLPGHEITCNESCADVGFFVDSVTGGRGFNISFRTQE